MFEEKTAEVLLKEALGQVSDRVDKREGAVIYDTIAPFCYELARAYADLDIALKQLFPQTASRDYLTLIAKQRGFEPKAAVPLEIRVYADAVLPIGSVLNMQEYNYTVEEDLGDGYCRAVCETAGSAPNSRIGIITPINYIEGLTEINFDGIITPGTDEEETEVFRRRFMDSIGKTQSFGGNKADYFAKLKALDGVGQVKVFPAYDWEGAGTVGIYITDTENAPASSELTERIKQLVDPVPYGSGSGIAPIGHIVDILPAETLVANVTAVIQVEENEERDYEAETRNIISNVIKNANEGWEDGAVRLYSSVMVAELMKTEGVVNVVSVRINGGIAMICGEKEIVAEGEVEVDVSYV